MIGTLGIPTIAACSLIFGSHTKYYTLSNGDFTVNGTLAGGFLRMRYSKINGIECKDLVTPGKDLECPSIDGFHVQKSIEK